MRPSWGEHCGKQTTHVCLPTICLILDEYQERGMFVCFCCRCCICCRTGLHIQRFRKLAWTDGQASRFAGCDTKSLFSVDVERFPKAPSSQLYVYIYIISMQNLHLVMYKHACVQCKFKRSKAENIKHIIEPHHVLTFVYVLFGFDFNKHLTRNGLARNHKERSNKLTR